jgi:large subunit ribosomal protein L25
MSTDRPTLAAARREITGKKVAAIRRDGRLPAVVFGRGLSSDSVSVDAHEFEQLRRHAGANALVDLSIDGQKPAPVLVHGVQLHRVTQRPLHIDLYLVRMTEELTVDVPLVPEGESEAVNTHGGTLLHVTEHVRIRALPDHLPQSIHYSVASLLTFDDLIHVSDLEIPGDATLLNDPGEIVAKVLPPRVEEAPEPVEAAEGEAAEGAEAGEGAEDGGPAGEGGQSEA